MKLPDAAAEAMVGGALSNKDYFALPMNGYEDEYEQWQEKHQCATWRLPVHALAVYYHDDSYWLLEKEATVD